MTDSSAYTAVCVRSVEARVIGIASTVIASKPPSSSSRVSHTLSGTSEEGEGRMRGFIWSFVPAETSSRLATSVPTTFAW